MADGRLLIGTRRYSSWSLRGWLAVRLAGLDVEEVVIRLEGASATSAVARTSPSGLVPFLEHQGIQIWESLSICEYCAEAYPAFWPQDKAARARARSISAEMHAGFRGLRQAMPMVLGRDGAGHGQTADALTDIERIETLWRETRAQFGGDGPYLFGALFTGADVMYAPVVARLLTYQPAIGEDTRAYCEAVRAYPLMDEWYRLAAAEPAEWQMDHYEKSP